MRVEGFEVSRPESKKVERLESNRIEGLESNKEEEEGNEEEEGTCRALLGKGDVPVHGSDDEAADSLEEASGIHAPVKPRLLEATSFRDSAHLGGRCRYGLSAATAGRWISSLRTDCSRVLVERDGGYVGIGVGRGVTFMSPYAFCIILVVTQTKLHMMRSTLMIMNVRGLYCHRANSRGKSSMKRRLCSSPQNVATAASSTDRHSKVARGSRLG